MATQLPSTGTPRAGQALISGSVPPAWANGNEPPKVLVVDDEESVRHGCVLALRLDGWRADGEASPLGGLERIGRSTEPYDAVVLDYAMPELDGIAFAARLEPEKRPPIVLTSAYGDGAAALAAMRHGIWDFLPKPLMPDELRQSVRRLYRRRRSSQDTSAWLDRVLWYCNRCDWAKAMVELEAGGAMRRSEVADLLAGLISQINGDDKRAVQAYQRARWWPTWHLQGVEIWNELSRRLV